jgi:hypothetical protein
MPEKVRSDSLSLPPALDETEWRPVQAGQGTAAREHSRQIEFLAEARRGDLELAVQSRQQLWTENHAIGPDPHFRLVFQCHDRRVRFEPNGLRRRGDNKPKRPVIGSGKRLRLAMKRA